MCKASKRSTDIKRHIDRAHSNVRPTADDNTDESVACAGSFNGDTVEICTGEEDALSRTTAVRTGKSEEDERSQLEEKEITQINNNSGIITPVFVDPKIDVKANRIFSSIITILPIYSYSFPVRM